MTILFITQAHTSNRGLSWTLCKPHFTIMRMSSGVDWVLVLVWWGGGGGASEVAAYAKHGLNAC